MRGAASTAPAPATGSAFGDAATGAIVVDAASAEPPPAATAPGAVPAPSPVNVAVALARLEIPVRALIRTADDPHGHRVRSLLEGSGVELTVPVTAVDPAGADVWGEAGRAAAVGADAVAVHAGPAMTVGGTGALRDLLGGVQPDVTTSYGPAGPRDTAPHVLDMLTVADVVTVTAGELARIAPGRPQDEVIADWLARGPVLLAITLGPHGVTAATTGRRPVSRPGVPVRVVDRVGADDAFTAGLLAGLHRRGLLGLGRRRALATLPALALADLLDEALLVAALTCTRRGADPPTAAELATAGLVQPV